MVGVDTLDDVDTDEDVEALDEVDADDDVEIRLPVGYACGYDSRQC